MPLQSETSRPVPKVTAATAGALLGGAIIWALETYLTRSQLPEIWREIIDWIVPALIALIAGYFAPASPARPAPYTPGGTGYTSHEPPQMTEDTPPL